MSSDTRYDRSKSDEPTGEEGEEHSPRAGAGARRDGEPGRDAGSEDLAARVRELEEELARKTDEIKTNQDRLLRALAESDNQRKRQERDKAEGIRYANEALVRDLLPVLDNLELAVGHASPDEVRGNAVLEGVQMVLRMFRDILEQHGIVEVEAEPGEPFDPEIHEATAQEPSNKYRPNTVISREARGYRLAGRLVRPARVVVAAPDRADEVEGGG